MLITVTDNLNGFTYTIRAVFPQATTQICVVHQIRNSCRYVVWKDMKKFTADMKVLYTAVNYEQAASTLAHFEQKWGSKYRYAVQSWQRNRDDLTAFFDFPIEIRTITYTSNIIETRTVRSVNTPKPNYCSQRTMLSQVRLAGNLRNKEEMVVGDV